MLKQTSEQECSTSQPVANTRQACYCDRQLEQIRGRLTLGPQMNNWATKSGLIQQLADGITVQRLSWMPNPVGTTDLGGVGHDSRARQITIERTD